MVTSTENQPTTPNAEEKTHGSLAMSKIQLHRCAEYFRALAHEAGGTTPGEANWDKVALECFVEYLQAYYPKFSATSEAENKANASRNGRDQPMIYADLFDQGESYRVRSAINRIAKMDRDLVIDQSFELAKTKNPKVKRSDVEAGLIAIGHID
jgi:hypothetical protein